MQIFIFLNLAVASIFAAPTTRSPESAAEILNQVHHVNEDGSYYFGFEASDGSFRIENRGIDGQVSGRYGYIDSNGQLQNLEYVSGQSAGKSLGFQAKIQTSNGRLASQSSSTAADQRLLDIQYSSVDDNQDGIPDSGATTAHIESPTITAAAPPTVLRFNVPSRLKSAVPLVPATADSTNLTFIPTVIPSGLGTQSTLPMSIQRGGSQPQEFQVIQQSVPFQSQFFPGFQQSFFQNHQPLALTRQQIALLGTEQIDPRFYQLGKDSRFQTNNNDNILRNQPVQLFPNPIGIPALFNGRIV